MADRARSRVVLLLVVLLSISVNGCANFQPSKSSDYVLQARDELDFDSIGDVQEEHEGVAGMFTDAEPTYFAIILGDTAAARLESRLADEGYAEGEANWSKRFDDRVVTIYVASLDGGEEVDVGGNKTSRADGRGVWIFIQG